MKRIKEITTAYRNLMVANEQKKKLAEERRKVCDECEFKTTMMKVEVCGKCYCPLVAKTMSDSNSCPMKKWVE